jgi:hypothetical protein
MANRIDASMDHVQRPTTQPSLNRTPTDPKFSKLPPPHNPMLPSRQLSDRSIRQRPLSIPVFAIA